MLIRVFISIPIKDPGVLSPVLSGLRRDRNVKVSPPGQMHITLRFIGDIDDRKIPKVESCVREAVKGIEPFMITIRGAGCFPNSKRPSVLWIGAEPSDILTRIAERISSGLSASNISFDDKPFRSHITVGRCRGPVDPSGFLNDNTGKVFDEFLCSEILIMRSELSPSGAKHTVLGRVPLTSHL